MNTLFRPLDNIGRAIEEKIRLAGINDITIVYKEKGSTVRLFTENSSYKGESQINTYINTQQRAN